MFVSIPDQISSAVQQFYTVSDFELDGEYPDLRGNKVTFGP